MTMAMLKESYADGWATDAVTIDLECMSSKFKAEVEAFIHAANQQQNRPRLQDSIPNRCFVSPVSHIT
ncbi:hypothetical protein DPMN_024027 [Dreissena polymorpha]|uniref:Uncharacterized protein n=1 Tax=Dreissena polymorpha TaxID=45954 RepID=A0A9D4LNT1_DREPO|nr:hypothetical protein DPMN_024027 [Dreissena polymorpha]